MQIPDTKNVLNEEIEQLQERIDILYQLESNQDNIIQDIHNRYILLEKYDTYLSDDFPLRIAISTLWWNTVSLEIKTYGYDGKPNLKIKDLNDLLRVTVYYEENRILREQSELEDRESNDNMEM